MDRVSHHVLNQLDVFIFSQLSDLFLDKLLLLGNLIFRLPIVVEYSLLDRLFFSLSCDKTLLDHLVEQLFKESEPLRFLDLAIAVRVKALEELFDLFISGSCIFGLEHADALLSQFIDLVPVDRSIAIDVECIEVFSRGRDRSGFC